MRRLALLLACATLLPLAARADDALSASQIEIMQRRGWLTPEFQSAARELIDAKQTARDAQAQEEKLEQGRPSLEKSAAAEDAKAAQLKAELARYDHPDESDFTALQEAMKNASAKPEDQKALAQAYVWTYPTSSHATEAEHDLQEIEKKIADQVQTTRDAEAAQLEAQAKLLQRVQAHALNLAEWRAFLQDKTETEVVRYLGEPSSRADEYWTYSGAWTTDPETGQKAGLQLNFNGGHVLSVAPVPGP